MDGSAAGKGHLLMRAIVDFIARASRVFLRDRNSTRLEVAVPVIAGEGLDGHWSRVIAVVDQAAQRTASAMQAQARALESLQAADYALDRLFEDLSDVMAIRPRRAVAMPVAVVAPRRTDLRQRQLAA